MKPLFALKDWTNGSTYTNIGSCRSFEDAKSKTRYALNFNENQDESLNEKFPDIHFTKPYT